MPDKNRELLASPTTPDPQEPPRFLFAGEKIKDLHSSLASKMFHLVQKRNGNIVNFDKRKITEAIFQAAQAVGGSDSSVSENLADEVVLFLYSSKGDHLPNVEQVQDAVEKVLIERGHAKTAKAYILYRDQRSKIRQQKVAAKPDSVEAGKEQDATDLALFVRVSDDNIVQWDRLRIISALKKEAGVAEEIAHKIAREVEDQIISARVKRLTSSLVRELVDAKLVEHGLEEARKKHSRLGLPLFDVEMILTDRNRENANIPHNPEATNMSLAETINKQYALAKVFSQDVADRPFPGRYPVCTIWASSTGPIAPGRAWNMSKSMGCLCPTPCPSPSRPNMPILCWPTWSNSRPPCRGILPGPSAGMPSTSFSRHT